MFTLVFLKFAHYECTDFGTHMVIQNTTKSKTTNFYHHLVHNTLPSTGCEFLLSTYSWN